MRIIPDATRNVNDTTKIISLKEERGTSASQRGNASSFSPDQDPEPATQQEELAGQTTALSPLAPKMGRAALKDEKARTRKVYARSAREKEERLVSHAHALTASSHNELAALSCKVQPGKDSGSSQPGKTYGAAKSKAYFQRYFPISEANYLRFEASLPESWNSHTKRTYRQIVASNLIRRWQHEDNTAAPIPSKLIERKARKTNLDHLKAHGVEISAYFHSTTEGRCRDFFSQPDA